MADSVSKAVCKGTGEWFAGVFGGLIELDPLFPIGQLNPILETRPKARPFRLFLDRINPNLLFLHNFACHERPGFL